MGVVPGSQPRHPGDMAQMLSHQSAQQRMYVATGMPPNAPSAQYGGVGAFGDQFRQRFESIQSQQSMSPYVASMMAGGQPSQYLPSPLMMTPPSTGVFRPPSEGPRYAPLPPLPVMPIMSTPFTPQLPPPMFGLASDRAAAMQDFRQDSMFAHAAQAPRILGTGMGIGAAAFAGSRVGGLWGGIAGGALGAMSGMAGGIGNMMMRPFQPMIARREMGAGIRDFSQDWAISGPDLHSRGFGFSRDASIRLAEQMQDLSKDKAFRRDTGGMFNTPDLMKIAQTSGRVGLMDTSQDIEGVTKNIKDVSRTLRKYMQLTQDPDMVGVLRELGQMRQFGMTLNDMERSAQMLNRYSRAAGTSIAGMKEMGLLGGATFQQAGLTAGSGVTYGMHAAMAARQAVATGGIQPRDLALLGGVQGMTQRNIQAQAAMMSMPLFGAAVGQWGSGGFGFNQGALGGMMSGGAQGMVTGAVGAMGAAVGQGGIGALALQPLQQRRLQTQAAESMTPEQGTNLRFQMALRTGSQLMGGKSDPGSFALGARMLYGDEVAEQMLVEGQNPAYFKSMRSHIQGAQRRLAREQRAENKANEMGTLSSIGQETGRALGRAWDYSPYGAAQRGITQAAGTIAGGFRRMGETLDDIHAEAEGTIVTRFSDRAVAGTAEQRKALAQMDTGAVSRLAYRPGGGARETDYSGRTNFQALRYGTGSSAMGMVDGLPDVLGAGLEHVTGSLVESAFGKDTTRKIVRYKAQQAREYGEAAKVAATEGLTDALREKTLASYASKTKSPSKAVNVREAAIQKIVSLAKVQVKLGTLGRAIGGVDLTSGGIDAAIRKSFEESGMSSEEAQKHMQNMSAEERAALRGDIIAQARRDVPDAASWFDDAEKAGVFEKRATRETTEQILKRKEALIQVGENALDLTFNAGLYDMGDKAGAGEVREMLKLGPKEAMLRTVAAAQAGGVKGASAAGLKAYMREFGKGRDEATVSAEYAKLLDKAKGDVQGMSADARERMTGMFTSGEAGDLDKTIKTVLSTSATAQDNMQMANLLGGGLQSIAGFTKGGGSELKGILESTGGLTGGDLVKSFDRAGLAKLRASGQGELASKIAQAQAEKDPGKRQALEEDVKQQVASLGEAAKKKEEEATTATGPEAKDLAMSEEAITALQSQMQSVFKDFIPAAENFSKGAERLNSAMDSDMFKAMLGDK